MNCHSSLRSSKNHGKHYLKCETSQNAYILILFAFYIHLDLVFPFHLIFLLYWKSSQIIAMSDEWYLEDLSRNIRTVFENKKIQGHLNLNNHHLHKYHILVDFLLHNILIIILFGF